MIPRAELPTYAVRLHHEQQGDVVVFVEPCPVCGIRHTHGADEGLLVGKPSYRAAHCRASMLRHRRDQHTGRHLCGYSLSLEKEK